MPAISILLPTYNGSRYLREQMDSILAQSLKDFELITVDDGSSDESAAILDSYAATDDRVSRLPSHDNRGQNARLLELIAQAKAPLIAFADQDDIWGAEKLQALQTGIADRAMAFGPSHLIDGDGEALGKTLMEALGVSHHPDDRLSILRSSRVSAHAMLCRRELLEQSLFASTSPFDWLISLVAAFAGGIAYVPGAATYHRLHGENSHNGAVLKKLRPWTFGVDDLKAEIARYRGKQAHFTAQLEGLAGAQALDPEMRATFSLCAALCRETFADGTQGNIGKRRELFGKLEDNLRPLAGSDRDWYFFQKQLWPLTLGLPLHAARLVPRPRPAA